MAILDTLITQLEKAAPTPPPQKAGNTRTFRQEVMGALALFTGGRSLTGLNGNLTQPDQNTPPAWLADLQPENQPFIPSMTVPEGHVLSYPVEQKVPPHSSQTTQPDPVQATQDWNTLLARSDPVTRQALRDVEPTLQNAEQALTRLPNHDATPERTGSDPASLLQNLSALMTARSIMAAHAPSAPNGMGWNAGTITPSIPATPSLPSSPDRADDAFPHVPPPSGTNTNTAMTQHDQMQRIIRTMTVTSRTLNQKLTSTPLARSGTLPAAMSPPPLARLADRMSGMIRQDPMTPHSTTTTHSPTINITVETRHDRPQDIARAVEVSTIRAITRQTLAQTG
ncbi:hypothetical protein NQF86_00330 [Bombella sp. TMW 2.2543]|uniref:Uncharacterized protein n=1 Tax=Bombella pluederhausensis TaxID=2967336 RepID=A0ABT3WFJ7_9PROT|nr:hypothetical protein [Bombella pluederhausensis]MCX5617119.1 hypothetical protein [Bombella pluederhausensis]